jgi:hypothetical protein
LAFQFVIHTTLPAATGIAAVPGFDNSADKTGKVKTQVFVVVQDILAPNILIQTLMGVPASM